MTRRLSLATGALLVLFGARSAIGAGSCAGSCVGRMASCRAERCPGARGEERRHCRDVCRAVTGCAAGAARTRTIATVVSECHSAGGMWTGRQRLEIKRGDCPAVTVMTIEADEPADDSLGVCRIYGRARDGVASVAIGAFEGVAVSPDGETVLFQVTDDFAGHLEILGSLVPSPHFAPPVEGIFVVHSDGTGLLKIADQTREAPFAVVPTSEFPFVAVNVKFSNGFSFSPDGKSVVFTDRGPGEDGTDAPQVFTLDPRTGDRVQLTRFTSSFVGVSPGGLSLDAFFLDDERIGGFVYDNAGENHILRIRRDGGDLQFLDIQQVARGGDIVNTFRIGGLFDNVASLKVGDAREIFVWKGDDVLQLTHLGRSDTLFPLRSRDRKHVFFQASADPFRANPSLTCQFFSIDVLGRHLRQLTRFDLGTTSAGGCARATADGCLVGAVIGAQDPATGALVFDSSCDPYGLSAVSQQLYALRPDGSGLRQLTNYRGTRADPDGGISVELPGPIAYQAPLK